MTNTHTHTHTSLTRLFNSIFHCAALIHVEPTAGTPRAVGALREAIRVGERATIRYASCLHHTGGVQPLVRSADHGKVR